MKIKILCLLLLILPVIAFAGVNTKNGNYSTAFTDILLESSGHELDLTRIYNSKATEVGWFGFGWGSPFESHMLVMPDGSVVVREYGTGSVSYFAPNGESKLSAGVDQIVALAVQRDKLDAEAASDLRRQLLANEELRRSNVIKYGIKTLLPVGTKVPSSTCVESAVTRINDEYQRTSCAQGNLDIVYTDYFDLMGRLVRKESGEYKLTIHYAGESPDRIEDTLGQKLFLKWTAAGRIAEARLDKDTKVLRYTYDERDNLILANELGGNFYRYEYDENHNMTRIGYIDNTQKLIQYDENSLATSVTEPDRSKATYAYRTDPSNPSLHYWTTTTHTSTTGDQSSREEEFMLTTNAAGFDRLTSRTSEVDSKKQDIVYDERGRIKIVRRDGFFAEYFYHPIFDKIRVVVNYGKSTVFTYDKAGNLISAYNTKDQLITLSYDRKKRVSRMVETNKTKKTLRELTFKYNELNKPIKITLIGKGVINVAYDQQGEITKVESKQSSVMAREVIMAFRTLLDVVKVAGVDLTI